MRLALTLGRTLAELLSSVSAEEMALWLALWHLEPWGDARTEVSQAIAASAVCGSMGAKVKPYDLIPKWGEEAKPHKMTAADFRAFAEAHNARLGTVG